jgi:urocanate reductase
MHMMTPLSQPKSDADLAADVVVVGAGAAGLAAAITAADAGATVIVVEANVDVGGHAILSGGGVSFGGGTSLQKKYGIVDSADQVYLDHTDHRSQLLGRSDRDLVRVFADESAATFEFLLQNGVKFKDGPPVPLPGSFNGSAPRRTSSAPSSDDWNDTINGTGGSGIVRPLEASARRKSARFLLRHRMTRILRKDSHRGDGRVSGIMTNHNGSQIMIRASRGVVIATGGHSSSVDFRRTIDPRLTEEYQTAGEPWTKKNAEGEFAALEIGAALWGLGIAGTEAERRLGGGLTITKTVHIGCRYGYIGLKWDPRSPIFARAGASGLTVRDFSDLMLVNQAGERFWNECDDSAAFINACLGTNGNLGTDGKANGGGPIWAIFDSNAVRREGWDPFPPNVDLNGWFFSADSLGALARQINNPYQRTPMAASSLEESVARYNSALAAGADLQFGKPVPRSSAEALQLRVLVPPFYAAWATPILHDSVTGLRIDQKCRVLTWRGDVIPGLYCAGESAGGYGLHGLPRALVFGRIAGREAGGERA